MKVLKVIHGYPERYSAGSEVYSQMLCHGLVEKGHQVTVFTRQENPYLQEYCVQREKDSMCPEIDVNLINMAHSTDAYRHDKVDLALNHLIQNNPFDLMHVGHLHHLSTSLINVAYQNNLPIVFTLHDFWLMCPKGQFLQVINSKGRELYPVCEYQEDKKCAINCYWRHFSSQNDQEDVQYWAKWVNKRMHYVKEMCSLVDLFIAPSKYLMERFTKQFFIPEEKIVFLDYGFDLNRLKNRKRKKQEEFVFGYIGTHRQAKGIDYLIKAFSKIPKHSKLIIWGPPLGNFTQALKRFVESDPSLTNRIEWRGGYQNGKIIGDVFNHIDCIVVPSIWGENSPLVIHEALQAKVPVITANYGGMQEYIQHEVNGLLFKHRNINDLACQMSRLVNDPTFASSFTKQGYLQSEDGNIPDMHHHVKSILEIYEKILQTRRFSNEKRSMAHHI
ncbi:MAG: 2-deoxystreptamine glucosyltransferase [Chlamydiae bacterium]|nr:2-deoxystreptamine glucosyltransferase [Chlamydiota bacterium]